MSSAKKLGKYELRREIGKGAMGVVYEAYDPFIQRTVAVKTIQKSLVDPAEMDEAFARFRREAQAAGRLTHPKIISIYDYGEDGELAYIAMEYVDGSELKEHLDAGAKLSVADCVRIMLQVLDALEYSHQRGVIHRDIKPANIMLTSDNRIKIADFGIAKIDASHLTQAGMVLGTPTYMSPEQFMSKDVDGRSDLYSAGVTLYQMLTGERPFTGSPITIMNKVMHQLPVPPSHHNPQVTPALDLVVMRSLAKSADERFQNAAEFMQALKQALSQRDSTPAISDSTLQPASPVAVTQQSDATALRQEDIALWREITDSDQRSAFEGYLQRFPHGEFAELAQRRLSAILQREQAALQEQERKRQALLAAAAREQRERAAREAAEAAQRARLETEARARAAAEQRQREEQARKAQLARHLSSLKADAERERAAAAAKQAQAATASAVRQQQLAALSSERAKQFAEVMEKRRAEAQAQEELDKESRRRLRRKLQRDIDS